MVKGTKKMLNANTCLDLRHHLLMAGGFSFDKFFLHSHVKKKNFQRVTLKYNLI